MTLKYRVTLTGIKGFFRVYELDAETTLYTFHKQLRSDLEFPQDQLILFKALDGKEGVVARYGLFDLGSGTVDNITLKQTLDAGVVKFVYFYDVTSRKSVDITFEEEVPGKKISPLFPLLTDTKGPSPLEFENGYVAFEDLPPEEKHLPGEEGWDDDDDFDLDEEEEEEEEDPDEDGKEIYDENE